MKKKLTEFIKGVTLALLYILIFLGAMNVLLLVASVIAYWAGYDPYDSIVNITGAVSLFSSLICVCIFMVTYYIRGIRPNDLIKTKNLTFSDVACTLVLAIGLRLLTSAFVLWGENVTVFKEALESAQETFNTDSLTAPGAIFLLASVCVVAPVFEEILFRCMVQRELKKAGGAVFAIIGQGVLFGLAHMNAVQTVFTVVIGILLGVIYHRTKNISMTILVHLFFNCSAILFLEDMSMIWYSVIIGLIMTFVSLLLIFVIHKKEQVETI